ELFRVVEVVLHGVGQVGVVVEHGKVELIRPPVLVRPRSAPLGSRGGDYGALALADASGILLLGHATFSSVREGHSGRSRLNGPTTYSGYNDRVHRWSATPFPRCASSPTWLRSPSG